MYWYKKANFVSVFIIVAAGSVEFAILRKRKRTREQNALLASEGFSEEGFSLIVKMFNPASIN